LLQPLPACLLLLLLALLLLLLGPWLQLVAVPHPLAQPRQTQPPAHSSADQTLHLKVLEH
jgi:hypothetical protein